MSTVELRVACEHVKKHNRHSPMNHQDKFVFVSYHSSVFAHHQHHTKPQSIIPLHKDVLPRPQRVEAGEDTVAGQLHVIH